MKWRFGSVQFGLLGLLGLFGSEKICGLVRFSKWPVRSTTRRKRNEQSWSSSSTPVLGPGGGGGRRDANYMDQIKRCYARTAEVRAASHNVSLAFTAAFALALSAAEHQ
jgi:hypothetical protein